MSGHLYIIGMGPGKKDMMTNEAFAAMVEADVIAGYTVYVDLVREHFPKKEFYTTPMRGEIQRCRACFDFLKKGKQVALICSGDAGVYGMAAPVWELLPEYEKEGVSPEDITVIPGVTAALSGAAVLGAPLGHDFCVISLSDLLTPWDRIEKRLRAAVEGDFAIAVYNPGGKNRPDHLKKACEILLDAGAEKTRVCGYVENIGREDVKSAVCTLEELKETKVNMFTTVFVGNSQSEIMAGKLVTKRGYGIK
ncbi:MAG: precorrin-3B C(17)-methyltransferase [Lachnospiraceae bacterium]|nr:precorrin-3B C(17)-methyltransferase [Lachnospiraceae bacterium]